MASPTARYATVGTPAKFRTARKEWEDMPEDIGRVMAREMDEIEERSIFADVVIHETSHGRLMETDQRLVAPLDSILISLIRPERLLDMARRFTPSSTSSRLV